MQFEKFDSSRVRVSPTDPEGIFVFPRLGTLNISLEIFLTCSSEEEANKIIYNTVQTPNIHRIPHGIGTAALSKREGAILVPITEFQEYTVFEKEDL